MLTGCEEVEDMIEVVCHVDRAGEGICTKVDMCSSQCVKRTC